MTRWIVAAVWLACGCPAGEREPAKQAATSEREPAKQAATAERADADAPERRTDVAAAPLAAEVGAGPSAEGSPEQRREAVLALLTDGATAKALPLASADEGKSFDPGLGDAMTPRASGGPRIKMEKPAIDGAIDPDIARRIVRRYFPEVRTCYERGLAKDPKLAGTVSLALEITAKGAVKSAKVATSDLADATVGACMAKSARKWEFPAPPDDAPASVTAPFVLEPPPLAPR